MSGCVVLSCPQGLNHSSRQLFCALRCGLRILAHRSELVNTPVTASPKFKSKLVLKEKKKDAVLMLPVLIK